MEFHTSKRCRRGGPYQLLDGVWCSHSSHSGICGGVLCHRKNHEEDVTMDFNKFRRWVFWLGMFGVIFMVGMLHTIGHHLGVFR